MTRTDTIESLVLSAHRLGRLAAIATGNPTPVAHWRTLSVLQSDGPLRVGELAAACRVTQPGMTKLLAAMVEDELVSRIMDSDDLRASLIAVTEKGERSLAAWQQELGTALDPFFEGLDADDWAALERTARILEERTVRERTIRERSPRTATKATAARS